MNKMTYNRTNFGQSKENFIFRKKVENMFQLSYCTM